MLLPGVEICACGTRQDPESCGRNTWTNIRKIKASTYEEISSLEKKICHLKDRKFWFEIVASRNFWTPELFHWFQERVLTPRNGFLDGYSEEDLRWIQRIPSNGNETIRTLEILSHRLTSARKHAIHQCFQQFYSCGNRPSPTDFTEDAILKRTQPLDMIQIKTWWVAATEMKLFIAQNSDDLRRS